MVLTKLPQLTLFFRNFWEDSQHTYANLQFNLSKEIAGRILRWSKKNIPDDALYADKSEVDKYGREEDSHVTVLYGLHDDDPEGIRAVLQNYKPFEAKLGKISAFRSDNMPFDVLKIEVQGKPLFSLHDKIKSTLDATVKWRHYQPHVTIAYVQKDFGKEFVGDTSFYGTKLVVDTLIFSGKNRKKTRIALNEN